MGFWSSMKKAFGGGSGERTETHRSAGGVVKVTYAEVKTAEDKYFFADDDEKRKIVQGVANQVAQTVTGKVKPKKTFESDDEPSEFHVVGHYLEMPVRVQLDMSFGTFSLEVKVQPPLSECYITVDHDEKGKAAYESSRADRDEWDEGDDSDDEKHFVSEHLYLQGDAEEMEQRKTLWARLPPDLQREMTGRLDGTRGRFSFYGEKIDLRHGANAMALPTAAEVIEGYLHLGVKLAAAVPVAWSNVSFD